MLLTRGQSFVILSERKNHELRNSLGEMSEWFMEPVLKTGDAERHRRFESYSLRQFYKLSYFG